MAAAVLPPNHNIGLSSSTNASPVMAPKSGVKQHENNDSRSKTNSPAQTKQSLPVNQNKPQSEESKPAVQVSEPLAPPPRPAASNPAETPDYFSALHNNGISGEFNPFEQSFGAPSAETPGGTRLPPVASLTSPVPGGNTNGGYNWNNSLRSGPLSPAMLEGPAGGDYFGNISSRGFPTPNESSLRTGLTPGGGGSMFPAPSPNSQALFNSLASGGATPGTIDFHRTAMNAAARSKNGPQYPATSAAPNGSGSNAMDAQHDATDAANGLFMLAKGGQANQFAVPNQNGQQQMQTRGQDSKRNVRNSGSIGSVSGPDANDSTGSQEDSKPNTRGGKNKKAAKTETANGRRKSEATPKGSNKRSKGNSGNANVDPALDPMDDDDDMDSDMDEDMKDMKDPKKMTDEEKRRNFLERNRVAALKCRQRKKQWLANLQAKVEMFSAENESLNTQVAQLHDEIRNLRTLLMGHKDCPVGHAQGIGSFLNGMQDPSAFAGQHVNPYGMAMASGPGMQPGMQRT